MKLKTKLTPTSTQQTFHQCIISQFDDKGVYAEGLKKRDKVKIELQRKLARFYARDWM